MANKIFLLLLIPSFCFAQKTIDVEKDNVNPIRDGLFYAVAGTPFSPYKYVKVVSGTPYFDEEWKKGIAVLPGGSRAKSDYVKLDLLSGEVVYKDSTGQELIATTPIAQIILSDPASAKDIVFKNTSVDHLPGSITNDGWYEVLESGTATLYKKIKKTISESKAFNSATTEQTINSMNQYYVAIGNEIIPVKKPKDISSVLTDKKNQLDEFIAANKVNGKTDADFMAVIEKYNSLAIGN